MTIQTHRSSFYLEFLASTLVNSLVTFITFSFLDGGRYYIFDADQSTMSWELPLRKAILLALGIRNKLP